MVAKNTYATLQDFKDYLSIEDIDPQDDEIINRLLEQACRTIEGECGRVFYPAVRTLYFDLPTDRVLDFQYADLLEVLSLTNGNSDAITSSDYDLYPYNRYPKFKLELKDVSTVQWYPASTGSTKKVISLSGIFAFQKDYDNAWISAGTLASAMSDTTTLTITMSAGHLVRVGNILRVDDELLIVGSVSNVTVTAIARGDNGSTAATHLISSVVYVWSFQEEYALACKQFANELYKLRTGVGQADERILPGGIIKKSGLMPKYVAGIIERARRKI